jgi:hypothetical protein
LFPNAAIVGLDINPVCKNYEDANITTVVGSQTDEELLRSLGEFDVIIDDGGHHMTEQVISFRELYPKLNKGGWYVIEDLHTSYWTKFLDSDYRTTEMLKEFVDEINAKSSHHRRASEDMAVKTRYQIESMFIYEGLALIKKPQ